ncbi:MAG: DNA-binding domain-containing protein [Verrucomicrobiota bacterium]|nr:DNA-binding domain-containing protein [Verrucomicrobiota bacterium]
MKRRTVPQPASSKLARFQKLMALAVMRPLTSEDTTQRQWIDKTSMSKVAASFVKPNDRLSSFERLQIYNQQYWWRILSCFGDDFPTLRAVIGEKKFDKLALAYLNECGSTSFTLRDLGRSLEAFVRDQPAFVSPHFQLAIDTIRLEWAQIVAFDGPAKEPVNLTSLQNKPATKIKLHLQPYLTLLDLEYPIDDLRLKVKSGEQRQSEAGTTPSRKVKVKKISLPKPKKTYLAVHRLENTVFYKTLDPIAYAILTALNGGASLEKACENALKGKSENELVRLAPKIQNWFGMCSGFGWFCK